MASVPEHKPRPRFWLSGWEAIQGTEQDFECVRIARRYLVLDCAVLLWVSVKGALQLQIATAAWFGFTQTVALPVFRCGKWKEQQI